MSEEKKTPTAEQENDDMRGSWAEVGQQFASLGESIATAFRSSWDSDAVEQMRDGLDSMAKTVSKAVDDAATSPQGQKIRTEAEKAVGSVRDAGEKTVEEIRPHLISALEQLNAKMEQMVTHMREDNAPAESEPDSTEASES